MAAVMEQASGLPAFVDFSDVWLAYNDELLAANHFAVEAFVQNCSVRSPLRT